MIRRALNPNRPEPRASRSGARLKPAVRGALTALVLILAGCGGTYVDDEHNFERALKPRPKDVQVGHSIYWQSSHFTDEHCYFLELRPAEGSSLLKTLTTAPHIAPVTDERQEIPPPGLVVERPKWFAPGPRSTYEVWASPSPFETFGALRDKKDGRIFVYGQVL